jgi:hypothetical protein
VNTNIPQQGSVSIIPGPTGSPTWPQVGMKLIDSLPIYAIITLAGILAFHSRANFQDFLIAGLSALGFKSWPKPIAQIGGATMAVLLALVFFARR